MFNLTHHFIEHGSAGNFSRLFFDIFIDDGEVLFLGKLAEFRQLPVDGEHLFVFHIGRLARIQKEWLRGGRIHANSIYQEVREKQEIQTYTNPSNLLFVRLGNVPCRPAGEWISLHRTGLPYVYPFCFPNLRLTHQKARGSALEPWAALRAAPASRNYVRLLNHVRTYFIKNS